MDPEEQDHESDEKPEEATNEAQLEQVIEGLGVTRQALSDLVNGKAGVSVEMAIRLSKAFGSTPEAWLGLQMAHDLWQARDRADGIEVEKFAAA